MPYPNLPDKFDSKPVFTPDMFLEYAQSIGKYDFNCPDRVILTYSKSLLQYVKDNYDHNVAAFHGTFIILDNYSVGILGDIGIGGPMTATSIEELGVLGASEFIIVGTSGAISKDMTIGDVAVIDKSIRDEEVSHHYLKSSKYVEASSELVNKLETSLTANNVMYTKGPSWTIDTPYRETEVEVRKYQQEGVLTVEMEAASVFAICKFRGYKSSAGLVISDSLADLNWDPQFHSVDLKEKLQHVIDAVIIC